MTKNKLFGKRGIIRSNRKLVDKKVVWKYQPVWQILHDYKANPEFAKSAKVPSELLLEGICYRWGTIKHIITNLDYSQVSLLERLLTLFNFNDNLLKL